MGLLCCSSVETIYLENAWRNQASSKHSKNVRAFMHSYEIWHGARTYNTNKDKKSKCKNYKLIFVVHSLILLFLY